MISFYRPFIVDHTTPDGSWVRSNMAQQHFLLGRPYQLFSPAELAIFAVQRSAEIRITVPKKVFVQQAAKLSWPGVGVVVGVEIVSNKQDATNGWWCVPTQNPLGNGSAVIPIRSEGSRGMDVS